MTNTIGAYDSETGNAVRETNPNEAQCTELSTEDLRAVSGGAGTMFLAFTFKLVAVKTVSWAHDD
jgi:hypothetical protein